VVKKSLSPKDFRDVSSVCVSCFATLGKCFAGVQKRARGVGHPREATTSSPDREVIEIAFGALALETRSPWSMRSVFPLG
jgi:hypothetical protein